MIHALTGNNAGQTEGLADFHCVSCGAFVVRESAEFLSYLVANRVAVYCSDCDPLPECVPDCLQARVLIIEGAGFVLTGMDRDAVVSVREGGSIHACLLAQNSTGS